RWPNCLGPCSRPRPENRDRKMRTTFAKTKRSQERRCCDGLQAEKHFRLLCARPVGLWSIPALAQRPENLLARQRETFCAATAGRAFSVNEIIFAPAFFRIFRLPQNRMDRVDRDSS